MYFKCNLINQYLKFQPYFANSPLPLSLNLNVDSAVLKNCLNSKINRIDDILRYFIKQGDTTKYTNYLNTAYDVIMTEKSSEIVTFFVEMVEVYSETHMEFSSLYTKVMKETVSKISNLPDEDLINKLIIKNLSISNVSKLNLFLTKASDKFNKNQLLHRLNTLDDSLLTKLSYAKKQLKDRLIA